MRWVCRALAILVKMTSVMTYLLILLPIVAIIIWLLRKEGSRRAQTQKKEEEFLASMRANPLAKTPPLEARPAAPILPVRPGPGSNQPVQPSVLPQGSSATPAPVLPIDITPSGLPVPDSPPQIASNAPSPAPLAAPRDGRCMVCGDAVDVRASDQNRWGVKIPEPGSERPTWVHFHCLASRLAEGQQMRGALTTLVTALDSVPNAHSADPAEVTLALQQARHALGR